MIDKEEYWAHRNVGKRGQGEAPSLIKALLVGTGYNRKMWRTRRHATKTTPYQSAAWKSTKSEIRARVGRHEAVARQKSLERGKVKR